MSDSILLGGNVDLGDSTEVKKHEDEEEKFEEMLEGLPDILRRLKMRTRKKMRRLKQKEDVRSQGEEEKMEKIRKKIVF